MLNIFVSREAMVALQTLAASANGRSFAGGSRIDHLIVLIAALGTTHNNSSQPLHNVASPLRNNKGLWRQEIFSTFFQSGGGTRKGGCLLGSSRQKGKEEWWTLENLNG
jgi:hypothetical protein